MITMYSFQYFFLINFDPLRPYRTLYKALKYDKPFITSGNYRIKKKFTSKMHHRAGCDLVKKVYGTNIPDKIVLLLFFNMSHPALSIIRGVNSL